MAACCSHMPLQVLHNCCVFVPIEKLMVWAMHSNLVINACVSEVQFFQYPETGAVPVASYDLRFFICAHNSLPK